MPSSPFWANWLVDLELAGFDADDLKHAHSIITTYGDHDIGVAGASNVVLGDRFRTRTIVTLDRRHFDTLRPIAGNRSTVLP